ncbi:DNA polymerase nu-like [Melitaea cinxia]|uniref:DNA polymerase nu-like n=1 Tax=Melitaea cinxia TaxID=113334 RepID=UPI001E26F4BD|nr:DNA polymerase nu-like [Melitaea cinxia]
MENNMYVNRNLLRVCEKHLSPFGQKVMSTLIKLKHGSSFDLIPHQKSSPDRSNTIHNEHEEIREAISWDDMFDSEIFKEFNLNDEINDEKNKNSDEHTFNVEFSQNINDNELRVDSVPKEDTKRKRKVATITEPPKKSKTKEVKKTIQSQLANKDGIMKFKKPKAVDEVKLNTKSSKNVTKAVKDKKVPKFVAPIKSQLPVEDVKFVIHIVNDSNIKDYRNKLDMIKDSEVITVLTYRNGFNQLNSQHTDDNCVPEGMLLQFQDAFYYFQEKINGLSEILKNIFTANTLICYEAKDLIIYLKCVFDLSFNICNIIDVKIGSNLINPDKPPEYFSDVQKLLDYTPEFTIATESTLQKAAWYITLLKDCSVFLRAMLVENGLWKVFVDIEMKILPIVAEMQYHGVAVDTYKLKTMENILLRRMNDIEAECYKAAGKNFQINSSVQVRTILYDELKLDTKSNVKIKETIGKGAKSTAEAMLRCLTSVHPLPKLILEYRHLHKAHATFVAGISQHVKDGVIRPTWDQTAAATGRIASNNPNLQAIPKTPFALVLFPKEVSGSKDHTLEFRSVYVPRLGFKLLAADFKHVECRVFAIHAKDDKLKDALRGQDIFRVLAAEWLKKPEADVTGEDRERTKRIVYASLYGAGARKLMEILSLGYEEVLSVMTSFNRTFPSLKSFGRSVVSECERRKGRLTIASGRARTFQNISSSNFSDKSHAERQAVNFVIQGTAADLCKMAMILTTERLSNASPPVQARLLLQIHDELVWEVQDQDMDRAAAIIKQTMENCGRECGMELTLAVAMYRGTSWANMEEFSPK